MNRVPDNNIKEQYSLIYLQALAIANGFAYQRIGMDFFKTDLAIYSDVNALLNDHPSADATLHFQLKATEKLTHCKEDKESISYSLDEATYDNLRNSPFKRLAMLILPEDWNKIDPLNVLLFSRLYYHNLFSEYYEKPLDNGKKSISICIPKTNLVTKSSLYEMMVECAQLTDLFNEVSHQFFIQKRHP